MSKKVLVLGNSGMLGSMVLYYLTNHSRLEVNSTSRKKSKKKGNYYLEVKDFIRSKRGYSYLRHFDYIINCIGILKPYCRDDDKKGIQSAIVVNSLFPHELSNYCNSSKIIQIATDCVFSGSKGNYHEDSIHDPIDIYGKSKTLGEVRHSNKFLNIRCSIIGPEINSAVNLLDWFLSQNKGSAVSGYSHHKWNGVTTLQYSKLCNIIVTKNKFNNLRKQSHTHNFVPNNKVTKYQLLNIINKAYQKDFKINNVSGIGLKIDRTLSTKFTQLNSVFKRYTMSQAIQELSDYQKNAIKPPWPKKRKN